MVELRHTGKNDPKKAIANLLPHFHSEENFQSTLIPLITLQKVIRFHKIWVWEDLVLPTYSLSCPRPVSSVRWKCRKICNWTRTPKTKVKNLKNGHVSLGDQQAHYLITTCIITEKGEDFNCTVKLNLQRMQRTYITNTHKNAQVII